MVGKEEEDRRKVNSLERKVGELEGLLGDSSKLAESRAKRRDGSQQNPSLSQGMSWKDFGRNLKKIASIALDKAR